MDIVRSVAAVRSWRRETPAGVRVGFVPTMGALHAGHQSLMKRAREECERVAVSVFVNPLQFGPTEDFAAYPRDEQGDAAAARAMGVDLLWFGADHDLFPRAPLTRVEVPALAAQLCGRSRPGHFGGVALIVAKLFHVVQPGRAYFGRKDFQQLAVVRRMAQDLDLDIEVIGCPIVREEDGLAMSSRNRRLTPAGRRAAAVLYRGLVAARRIFARGERNRGALCAALESAIRSEAAVAIEYLELVSPEELKPITTATVGAVLLVAAHVDGVRLIDNVTLGEDESTAV